mgnify:CR=1 FL=1
MHPDPHALVIALSTPGMGELVVILVIILLLFGGAKIPEIARNLGKGLNEFKKGLSGRSSDDKESQKKNR